MNVYLIRGNHDDQRTCTWWMEHGFHFACDGLKFRNCWLTHRPDTSRAGGCDLNIHGHLHNVWLCGKFVSSEFKEMNNENWKAQSKGSAIEQIIASFNREAIWAKAVQHKREEGVLLNAPQDIGMLIGEVKKDFGIEHGDAIKRKIFKEFYPDIERGIMAGFPEWYKKKLIE